MNQIMQEIPNSFGDIAWGHVATIDVVGKFCQLNLITCLVAGTDERCWQ